MDRRQCESLIMEKLEEIVAIYHEYNPEGRYITLTYANYSGAEYFDIVNRYYDEDKEYQINYNNIEGSVNRG